MAAHEEAEPSNVDFVKEYLRGQNLEQVGRTEEAVGLYERSIAAGFDSSGPYDRLVSIYGDQARHTDVIRIAGAALSNVQTYPDKKAWYERVRLEAERKLTKLPQAAPKRRA